MQPDDPLRVRNEYENFPGNFPGNLQEKNRFAVVIKRIYKIFFRVYAVLKYDGFAVFFHRLIRKIKTGRKDPLYHFYNIIEETAEDYAAWIRKNEPSQSELKEQVTLAENLTCRPLISILVPVYKTPLPILKAMIESVQAQTYQNWELCIGNASSDEKKIVKTLDDYAAADPRLVIKHLESNLGISGNSNAVLEICSGEFIGLLDHDDLLAPFALFEIVSTLNRWPDSDFFYSDRDLIDIDGKNRFSPFFRPDWSPEMLVSCNYLSQFNVFRKSLLEKTGGFDPQKDGSQDLDLYYRLIGLSRRVVHIPKMLYHWRLQDTSVSSGLQAKPYVLEAQKKTLQDYFNQLGISAEIANLSPADVWISWPVSGKTRVSIIIPLTSGSIKKARRIMKRFSRKTAYPDLEFVFVLPGREKNDIKKLAAGEFRACLVYTGEPFSRSSALISGYQNSKGDTLLFLNEELQPIYSGWLEELVRWAEGDSIGAVGSLLLNPDRRIAYGGSVLANGNLTQLFFGLGLNRITTSPFGQYDWLRNLSVLTSDCVMVKRKVFEESGVLESGLDDTGMLLQLCREITRKVVKGCF